MTPCQCLGGVGTALPGPDPEPGERLRLVRLEDGELSLASSCPGTWRHHNRSHNHSDRDNMSRGMMTSDMHDMAFTQILRCSSNKT